jgi:hypothetical protein
MQGLMMMLYFQSSKSAVPTRHFGEIYICRSLIGIRENGEKRGLTRFLAVPLLPTSANSGRREGKLSISKQIGHSKVIGADRTGRNRIGGDAQPAEANPRSLDSGAVCIRALARNDM